MTRLQRIASIVTMLPEAWIEVWAWIGEFTADGTELGFVTCWVCRLLWIAVSALFAWLWIDLIIGAVV